MKLITQVGCLVFLALASAERGQSRWSRQISSYTSDLTDWVPLPGPGPVEEDPLPPIKRQAIAEPRILAEPVFPGFARPNGFNQQEFPPRNYFNSPTNRQLYLQSVPAVPSAPQNFLSDQGFNQGIAQNIRFGLSQPSFPLNQGFVSQPFPFDAMPQFKPRLPAPPSNPIKFESIPKMNLPLSPQAKPFNQGANKPDTPKFVDGYRVVENISISSDLSKYKKRPQSLQKIKFESVPRTEMMPPKAKSEREEVQLLYVPLESLNRGHFNFRSPVSSSQLLNTDPQALQRPGPIKQTYPTDYQRQGQGQGQKHLESFNDDQSSPLLNAEPQQTFQRAGPIKQTYQNTDYQRPSQKPSESFNDNQNQPLNTEPRQPFPRPGPIKQTYPNTDYQKQGQKPLESYSEDQDFFNNFGNVDQVPKYSTQTTPFPTAPPTTPKPKKLKPHQPPLAIFLTHDSRKDNQPKVGDVLASLKNAETIAVLDSVNPQTAPKVFIGPSSLNPPEKYVKFELPYLSNIEHTDKKLRQLPFFVAPLSYHTPQGFAKIPFPAPHVGSVVINSQIRDRIAPSTPAARVIPNSYSTSPQSYRLEPKTTTQKPTVTYYSTAAPKTNAPPSYQSDRYNIEPQTVNAVRPQVAEVAPAKTGSFFLSNTYNQAQPGDFPKPSYPRPPSQPNYNPPSQPNYNPTKLPETPTTPKTVYSTTANKISTYPNLLETHNPYSINQAFHFSTPSDYHHLFDESYPNQELGQQSTPPATASSTQKPTSSIKPEPVTEKQRISSSPPNYSQNYSPEIHYSSDLQSSRYPSYSQEYTSKPELTSQYVPSSVADNSATISSASPNDYSSIDSQAPLRQYDANSSYETETKSPYSYNQYETNYQSSYQPEAQNTTSTTTTTTTTTLAPTPTVRRVPSRTKGRPRSTTPRPDSGESTTRTVASRKPLRERRPLPPRNKYEPNKITPERSTRKPSEPSENTTRNYRNRTRGRVQYKHSESEDNHFKTNKQSSKEADLAYQRDVLHQNYPVTLMERASTIDIEAITEPSPRISSTKNLEPYDTENAYSYDRVSFSQHIPTSSKEETQTIPSRSEIQTEAAFVSKFDNEYTYQSRSSLAPVDAVSSYGETSPEKEDESYARQTTPIQNSPQPETISYSTEPSSIATESQSQSHSANADYNAKQQQQQQQQEKEDVTTNQEFDSTKVSQEAETEVNVVQTTPSYNRVRVRPGVIRQYHQASSTTTTEASKTKSDRRRPIQAVTYRPAFNGRRTTMRIEDIEADLKTKPVHARPEQDYRHPVYRPDPTTEAAASQTPETTTKRNGFRKRRPGYSTSTTEASVTTATAKRTQNYEVKGRFRGRRPTTEKSTEKTEAPTEITTTPRTSTRYSRPRLSDRYNKKTESVEEDQESNYSINHPKYVELDSDTWSPKAAGDTFKPYNPNDILEEKKVNYDKYDKYDAEDADIITARNEYDDILISVTPASNNRNTKKIPDIPPTLEALVEQSKTTHSSDNGEQMSTFETMLEEVMKSLEEQDEDEYSRNVMKHKGGEIGEIPPERIISSGDNYSKTTAVEQPEATTVAAVVEDSTHIENEEAKNNEQQTRRRGFWKKVAVRPITESIEAAESQYYTSTANRLSHTVTLSKTVHDKNGNYDKSKVTTYKPAFQFIKDMFNGDYEDNDDTPLLDIPKIKPNTGDDKVTTETTESIKEVQETTQSVTEKDTNKASDKTLIDSSYQSTPTEPTSEANAYIDRSDGFNFMEYLFGVTPEDKEEINTKSKSKNDTETIKAQEKFNEHTTEQKNNKEITTETTYVPEEITPVPTDANQELVTEFEIKRVKKDDNKAPVTETTREDKIETTSVSSFMENPPVSTSMSVEVSHETEMCYRGRCIKTSSDNL